MGRKEKVIPIIIVHNDKREKLVKQTIESFFNNPCGRNYKFMTSSDTVGNESNYIWLRNQKAKEIDFDYDYIVFADDDVYFSKDWLKEMVKELEANPDVWILGAASYWGHKVIEERENININEKVMPGICMLMSKDTWETVGPWDENKTKTTAICQRVIDKGGKLAVMRDKTLVVHCGITSILNARGFSDRTKQGILDLTSKVGAKVNG